MFIPEREIWLKATAQAMVDLTIVRNTMHGPIHLPADFFYYLASIHMVLHSSQP